MGIANDMKTLSEDIITAYKQRVKDSEVLVKEVQKTLKGFQKDHLEMSTALRNNLAKGETDRLNDYNNLMTSIQEKVKEIQTYTSNLLTESAAAHKEMAAALKEGLAKGETVRFEDFNTMMGNIQNKVKDISLNTNKLLKEFTAAHKEMAAALKESLSKGETDRLKDFEDMMGNIQNEVKDISLNTIKLLKEFTATHKEMVAALRESLSKGETDRLKDFEDMMGNIQNEVKDISLNTIKLLKEFTSAHKEMATALRESLAKGEIDRLQDFKEMMENIQNEVKDIEEFSMNLLNEFAAVHEEMASALSDNLSKGETDRLKDFEDMMKNIQNEIKNIENYIARLLGGFASERSQMADEWSKLTTTIAEIKAKAEITPVSKAIVDKPPQTKDIKPESKKEEVKPEPKKEKPIAAGKKVKVEMTLEDKVLNYINKHPKGVKVGEMEKPLGEIRMKLGYIAKRLLDDGKVLKLENVYYPKSKKEK